MFGAAVAGIVSLVVALSTSDFTIHPPAFAFAASCFGLAGFMLGPPAADILAIFMQLVTAVVAAEARYFDIDLGDKPFRPVAATVFLVMVIVVTALLCLHPA